MGYSQLSNQVILWHPLLFICSIVYRSVISLSQSHLSLYLSILIDNNNSYSSLSFLRHIGKINLNYLTGELSLNKLDYYEIGKRIRKCHLKPLFLFVRPFLSAQITCCVTSCLKTLLFFSSLCPKPRNTADSSTKNIPASSRPLLTLLIVSENPPGKKALEIKDFFITKYRFFQNRTLSYRPISIFFSCCCISRLTPATGLISGFYQFLPGALIAFFVAFFNRAYTGAIRIMEFL